MAGLGRDLVVNLAANTSKFRKGMNDAQGILGRFGSGVKGVIGTLTSFKAALTGLAAAAGVGVALNKVIANINKLDAVAKNAARTGLSGAFLQRLEFAADQSGVSAEGMTKAIEKMTIAVGAGSKSFADIGMNIDTLRRLAPEEQFLAVADHISKLPTAADRANAAFKVFGRSGVEMVTLLNSGAKGLNELMAKAKELGIGIRDSDLKKIEAANDAWGQMKASVGALWDQITVGLAPAITDLATRISLLIPPVTKFFDAWNQMGADKWTWLGDTLVAAFDVGIEAVLAKWDSMLDTMLSRAKETMGTMAEEFAFGKRMDTGDKTRQMIERAKRGKDIEANPLAAAQGRLNARLKKLDVPEKKNIGNADHANREQWEAGVGMVPPADVLAAAAARSDEAQQANFAGLFGSIADKTSGPLAALKQAALDKFTGMRLDANFLGNVAAKAFGVGGDKIAQEQPKTFSPKLAGAMARGSVEAYSTIIQAMVTRGKDPVVKATEMQTKQLLKGMKESKPVFNFLEAFT